MAIQLRRGDYTDFDPSQLLDGELAVVLENDPNTDDGTGTYVSYGDSNVKRLLTEDDDVEVPIASSETAGIVKPDGTTIEVDEDGTIHGSSTVSPSDTAPVMDGSTASAGSSDDYARGDHRHPTDTSRASASDLSAHTGNTSIHVSTSDRTAWNNKADTTPATTSTYGLVKPDGTTVKVNGSGALSVPIADTGNVGLVKPDNTSVTIDNDGTLHTQGAAIASSETAGIVAPDDDSFYVDSYDGRMTLNPATDSTLGGVKISEYEAVGMQSDDHSLYVKTDESTITKNEYGQLTVIGGGGGGSVIDPYDSDPEMDGTASAGSSDDYARGDHVHPTDTSRASASDLTSHTSDTTVHVTAAERSTWNAKASTATATTSANGLMSSSDKSKLDSIDTSALATATANANNAAQSANSAATAANTAASSANDAAERAEDAIDAIGDISEQAVPLMSESTRGGAKLGHGLTVEDGALGIGSVTDPTDAGPIVELTAKGWAEQDTTVDPPSPSPSYPQEIRRVTGHTISGKTGRYVDINVTHDGTTTTIPIPLPQRGWVAALPDGTADTLTLDGAGGYVWTLNTAEYTLSGNESGWTKSPVTTADVYYFNSKNKINPDMLSVAHYYDVIATHFVGRNVSTPNSIENDRAFVNVSFAVGTFADVADFTSWLASNPVTVLYPLATPTTEQGYVDMPTVPVHAILTTDLHDLTVRCCADSSAAEISAAWGKRYESRIANLESAVAELIAGA